MTPLVSVWMPSYNHAPYLPAAIESVLEQTLRDVELVIADDGSRDGSLDIAKRYAAAHPDRITVLTHPGHANLGVARSANLAVAQARGRFFAGMASDDMLYPDALERATEFLERHPNVGYVYGYAHLVDEHGRKLPDVRAFGADLTRRGRTLERLVQGNQIPAMTIMLRRECLEQAGGQDASVVYTDWELWARAAAHWEVGFIPCPLAMYRVHAANTGFDIPWEQNLERSLEVTSLFREHADSVGGGFAEPRVRATVELQLAFLRFAEGDLRGAKSILPLAFVRDPSLSSDGRWLSDWLRARLLDPLARDGDGFGPWILVNIAPFLDRRAQRRLRREAVAAEREASAVRSARAGQMSTARRKALEAVTRSPRLLADRRLTTVLLDSLVGGGPADGLRRIKRRVLGYR
jgi:glycosyltransferase involved in cell wall biosynthesis